MTEFQSDDHTHGASALYLVGALDETTEAAFERHLARCATCRQECEELGPAATGLSHLSTEQFHGIVAAGSPAEPIDPDGAGVPGTQVFPPR
jgi:Putative zinc-finger